MLKPDLFFALCGWLLSRKGFSKGSLSLFSHPCQGLCKVCMLESDMIFVLCVWHLSREGFSKGSVSAINPLSLGLMALPHRSVILIKESEVGMLESDLFLLCAGAILSREGFSKSPFIVQCSFTRALQGLYT